MRSGNLRTLTTCGSLTSADASGLAARVVHCQKHTYDVYIGRPGPWGNPYSHLPRSRAQAQVATRFDAVCAYLEYLARAPALLVQVPTLSHKVLGCWCVPELCHGHVLVRLAAGWTIDQVRAWLRDEVRG